MSAIAGLLHLDGRPVERRDLERMANALAAHGPDRRGIYASGELGLAHLLMRMTPEDVFDRQPFRGPSGAVIAADLRLDNRDDLIPALGLDAAQAMASSDAVLVLAAWERWGDEAWARLRGPFAVAIWDPSKCTLTLARDPLGLNVVIWHKSKRFVAFATMPRGLFALADVPRVLNEEKIADFLVLNHTEHETTVYRDVFRLPPAHIARIEPSGQMTIRRYWSAADIRPVRLGSDQAYADGMRECLDRAVRRQLRSIHPVGCDLSGGLDSSAVATLAARALAEKGQRLAAFTQVPREGFTGPVPNGWYADEMPYVEAIKTALGNVDVTYIRNSDCDDFAELDRMFPILEGPIRNPTNLGWMLAILRSARTRNRRVLLGGLAGNFTISWDGWSQAVDHLLQGRLALAFRQWRLFYRTSGYSRLTTFRKLFVNSLLPEPVDSWINRIRRRGAAAWQDHAAIRLDFAAEMKVDERARRVGHDFRYRPRAGARAARLAGLTSVDYIGEWRAATLALSGVESRDPTADLDVVMFCLSIPDEQYLAEGVDRSLVRRAMWGLLPPIVLSNRRRGMQAADWYEKLEQRRPTMKTEINDLAQSVLACKAVDLDRLQNAVRTWPAGDWHKRSVIEEYQLALSRGLATGRFLRWFEQSN